MTESDDDRLRGRLVVATFGDDAGLTLFLGSLLFFVGTWRLTAATGDLATLGNTLSAVQEGQLHLERLVYAVEDGWGPGVTEVGGRRYGRGYAQAVIALPALWTLQAVSKVVAPGIAVAAAWGALAVAFADRVGESFDRRRTARLAGAGVGVAVLGISIVVVRPSEPAARPLLALGLSTVVVAALVPVAVYRLVLPIHGGTVAACTGAGVALASPVAYWATVPRHHSLVALLAVTAVAGVHRSRTASGGRATRLRGLPYAAAGLALWVNPPDGLILLVALAVVDLSVGPRPDLESGATMVGALGLSALPFVATALATEGATLAPLGAVAEEWSAAGVLSLDHVVTVFVRSEFTATPVGYLAVGPINLKVSGAPLTLSVVEAMPLVGALAAVPALLYRRYDSGTFELRPTTTAARATDLLVVTYLALLVVTYLPTLPAESSVTVRRLHPLYPLAGYLLVRLEFVRDALRDWHFLARVYGASAVFGLGAFVLFGGVVAAGPHGVARLHAMIAFGAAAVLVYWGVVATLLDEEQTRSTAAGLALAGASTTLFVVLAAFVYLPGERYALPAGRLIAGALALW